MKKKKNIGTPMWIILFVKAKPDKNVRGGGELGWHWIAFHLKQNIFLSFCVILTKEMKNRVILT